MRHKSELKLTRQSKAPDPVSSLTPDEEARLMSLADVALHNEPAKSTAVAGQHAHREHESLKRALRDAVENLRRQQGHVDKAA